ncbi:MAG: hypothetical protein HDS74_00795 [Bacteroidales bacterium]|nr:hypothetical protein [Bacteroidales bacterium]MBD5216983.1 hypothetical protein [Bacteroidales bacterium]
MKPVFSKKYVWIPSALAVYSLILAVINFSDEYLKWTEASRRYWITLAIQMVIIAAVAFFLKKKDRLKNEREDLAKKIEEQKKGLK